MKEAAVADQVRKLNGNLDRWRTKVTRFAADSIPSLGTNEASLECPVTVISGPNGVGKSTLLRAIWAALDPLAAESTVADDRKLVSGSISIDGLVDGGEFSLRVGFSPDGIISAVEPAIPVSFIDSGSDALLLQKRLREFASAEELTNGIALRELQAPDLATISYLTRRDYRSVSLYEVELENVAPFFEVTYGDDKYDSRTMGAGEISAFYVWWMLERAPTDSIVIIEEPEAYLSHACQQALINYIIDAAVKRRIFVIISSHSAPVITSLPDRALIFLSRTATGLLLTSDRIPPQLLKTVGIEAPIKAVVFVEDSLAKLFGKAILERFDPRLARQILFEVRQGEGEITNALRITKDFSQPLRFIGWYDGDMHGKVSQDLTPISAFLPGEMRFEAAFRRMIVSDSSALSNALGQGELSSILGGLEGLEDHDWFHEFASALGLSREQLFPTALRVWLDDPQNFEAAKASYEAFVLKLG